MSGNLVVCCFDLMFWLSFETVFLMFKTLRTTNAVKLLFCLYLLLVFYQRNMAQKLVGKLYSIMI